MGLTPEEIKAAERRIQQIKSEIQSILASDGQFEERVARWEALLTESLHLQELLDQDG